MPKQKTTITILLLLASLGLCAALIITIKITSSPQPAETTPTDKASAAIPGQPVALQQRTSDPVDLTPAAKPAEEITEHKEFAEVVAVESLENLRASISDQVSTDVAIVVGWTHSPKGRVASVRKLGNQLFPEEIEALYAYMNKPFSSQNTMKLLTFNALKNDIFNVLAQQTKPPRQLGALLAQMYNNPKHDEVWKAYCIQFIGEYWSLTDDSTEDAKLEKESMLSACQHAAKCSNSPLAGTALITLKSISATDPKITTVAVQDAAMQIASSKQACSSARATAIQVCAQLRTAAILPLSRQLMISANDDTMLRMSAIAAVGMLGNRSDKQQLNQLAASGDSRLRTAAKGALTRINSQNSK